MAASHSERGLPALSAAATVLVALAVLAGPSAAGAGEADRDPHPKLLPEADPAANPDRTVPAAAATDADGILTVEAARWDDTTSPMRLVWDVRVAGGATIPCFDCFYLASHVRRFLTKVLDEPWSAGLTAIDGFDPTKSAPGDFGGNGWAVTLRVAEDGDGFATTGRDGGKAVADAAVRWLLACGDDAPCRSQRLGVTQVTSANRAWSVATCNRPVRDAAPQPVDPLYHDVVQNPPAPDVLSSVNRRVFAAGVQVALPRFTPRYRTDDGVTVVGGFRRTDCPQKDGG